MFCITFHRGLQLLRILDHVDDLLIAAGTCCFFNLNSEFALFQNSSCIGKAAFCFTYRCRFTCQRSLIDHCFSCCNISVKRNHITHMYAYQITCFNRRNRYKNLLSVFVYKPYFLCIDRHASCKVIDGFLMCPFLKDLTDSKQEHGGTCSIEVTAEHRYTDCCCIQNRYLQFSLHQSTYTMINVFY